MAWETDTITTHDDAALYCCSCTITMTMQRTSTHCRRDEGGCLYL